MKKKTQKTIRKNKSSSSAIIFPVERWLIPSLHFSHVHGLARIFLITEICLSVLVVSGTLLLFVLSVL